VYGVDEAIFRSMGSGEAQAGAVPSVSLLCAPHCAWRALGDGECNPECNNSACFWDRQDCRPGASGCTADCHPDWIGDGYCDEACFNGTCKWDKRDCLKKGEKACAAGCMPDMLADGECDAACNLEGCNFDNGDCFHSHDECYRRSDGADYRGTVSTTATGMECQMWSEQTPNQHTKTHANYPRSGLGGHNFCRNPDGEPKPWCYTMDPEGRWDLCDVGEPSTSPCISPPPPSPQQPSPLNPPPPPPPPPNPSPKMPPPLACPAECDSLGGDGVCDKACNITTCVWDKGDCRDVLKAVLASAKLMEYVDRSALSELVAAQGGWLRQGVYIGVVVGLCTAFACLIALCQARRRKRNPRAGKYTPYGDTGDPLDMMGDAGDEEGKVGPDSAD